MKTCVKHVLSSMVVASAVLLSSNSFAASAPCATELCLSSKADAEQTPMCKDPVDDFFKIKKKKNGVFDPKKTLKARRDYLYNCESGNTVEKERILAMYGMIVKW